MDEIKRAEPRYIKATAEFTFQGNAVCCEQCPCLETYSRRQCRLTGEYLPDIKTIGYNCPLKFDYMEVSNEYIELSDESEPDSE